MNHWAKQAVFYQIYPRSFQDTNHDGVGDLEGIITRLDYLNDGTPHSLGVDAIWLSPIYESPMLDFGYDVTDHKSVSPLFGTLDQFDSLIRETHRRGMKLILDFIPNHTSSSHPWFLESKSSLNSPKRDWYVWRDPRADGSLPTNWLSVFGGPAWSYDEKTKQYYLHTFLAGQPDLNLRNPSVRKELESILRFWLDRGVDGFRVDAAIHLVEDVQFRDNPPNPRYRAGALDPYESYLHRFTHAQPETFEYIDEIARILQSYGTDKFLVTETHLGDLFGERADETVKHFGDEHGALHLPFNFGLIGIPWNPGSVSAFIGDYERETRGKLWPNYVLGNHDQSRVATRLGTARARVAAMLELTLRGTPFIYYGEELGMEDVPMPQKSNDPRGKRTPSRDPYRTPMQWSSFKRAGFSNVPSWLPVHEKYRTVNAESESAEPHSLLNLYRKLVWTRKSSQALRLGSYREIEAGNRAVLAYAREFEEERVAVLLNFSPATQKVSFQAGSPRFGLPRGKAGEAGEMLCTTHMDREVGDVENNRTIELRPDEGVIMLCP